MAWDRQILDSAPLIKYFLKVWQILVLFLTLTWFVGCATEVLGPPKGGAYTDIYHEQVFHERVRRLSGISLGATRAQVIQAFGEPTELRQPGEKVVFVYRLRCPKTDAPFSNQSRVVYLEWETQITFDQRGRVVATSPQP